VKPDYSNAQGLEIFDPDEGWIEWMSSEGEDLKYHIGNEDDLDQLKWEMDEE
jgi:hypothetical protein